MSMIFPENRHPLFRIMLWHTTVSTDVRRIDGSPWIAWRLLFGRGPWPCSRPQGVDTQYVFEIFGACLPSAHCCSRRGRMAAAPHDIVREGTQEPRKRDIAAPEGSCSIALSCDGALMRLDPVLAN